MMYKLIEQQKFSPYTECYDDKLFMFKDRKYTHGVCFHLFGISVRNYFILFLFREEVNVIIRKCFVVDAVSFM